MKRASYPVTYTIQKTCFIWKDKPADQECNFTQKLMTTILSFKDLTAIIFAMCNLLYILPVLKFWPFSLYCVQKFIMSNFDKSSWWVILLWTALYWHGLLDSSTQSLRCSTLYKIIAVIFKCINFVDDFNSLKLFLVWIEEHVYKTSKSQLGTNEYISPLFDCYPLQILNVLFWSTRVNAWD